jgi:hypothetical protein
MWLICRQRLEGPCRSPRILTHVVNFQRAIIFGSRLDMGRHL